MRRSLYVTLGLLVLASVLSAADDDLKPNPPYKHWSNFKVGSTVTLKQVIHDKRVDNPHQIDVTGRPEGDAERLNTYTLIELTPQRAVVQLTTTEVERGSMTEHSPVKLIYPATIHRRHHAGTTPKDKLKNFKEATEEVTVGGQKIKCAVVESEMKIAGETSISKVWTSDKVPGSTVKLVSSKKQGDDVLFETTVTVVSYKLGGGE